MNFGKPLKHTKEIMLMKFLGGLRGVEHKGPVRDTNMSRQQHAEI